MTKSTNIDVWVVSHAILAVVHLAGAISQKAKNLLVPLCAHHDSYPKIIGLQQRALLYHHLDQQSRLSATHREIEEISRQPITDKIRRLIANREWNTNLLTEEEVPSTYLTVRKGLEQGDSVEKELESTGQ